MQTLRKIAHATKTIAVVSLTFFTCALALLLAFAMIVTGEEKERVSHESR